MSYFDTGRPQPDPAAIIEGVCRALAYLSTVDAARGTEIRQATGFGKGNAAWFEAWRAMTAAGLVEQYPAQTPHEALNPRVRWYLTPRGETVLWLLLAGATMPEGVPA